MYYFSCAIYGPLINQSRRIGVVVGEVGREYVFFGRSQPFPLLDTLTSRHSSTFPSLRFRSIPSSPFDVNGREG